MNHPVTINNPAIFVVAVLAIVIAAFYAHLYSRRRHSDMLRRRFGPEYDRVVGQEQSVTRAENVLEFRQKARKAIQLRSLVPGDRLAFVSRWNDIQQQFSDEPCEAVLGADLLINDLMEARGYPIDNFEQRWELISVDHPVLVQNYRAAHDVAMRQKSGHVTAEDLRKAMIHYRSLFDELLRESAADRQQA